MPSEDDESPNGPRGRFVGANGVGRTRPVVAEPPPVELPVRVTVALAEGTGVPLAEASAAVKHLQAVNTWYMLQSVGI